MTRKEILQEAEKCVCGQREEDYGSPEENFSMIAHLWSVYLNKYISSKDVAMLMSLLKIARIKAGTKSDSYIDLAGYAACAGEIDNTSADVKLKPSEDSRYIGVFQSRDSLDKYTYGHEEDYAFVKNMVNGDYTGKYIYRDGKWKLDRLAKKECDLH